ncbi:dephospho-CoA kinase [bacterium]|nr:dephospho-CoA kinase [Chloroflexi bacterium CFX6]RIL10495.1 MAG: dephospho-CoA kinase [bacterium]
MARSLAFASGRGKPLGPHRCPRHRKDRPASPTAARRVTSRAACDRIRGVSKAAQRLIGVTGAAGCGKSTVCRWLAEQGTATLDADQVVHDILARDAAVIRAVVARFGGGVERATGGIDRRALADTVFGDPAALEDLERLVHPAVHAAVRGWLDRIRTPVVAVEAVKLVESGLAATCSDVWLVVCAAAEQRSRLRDRGWSHDVIDRRLAASPPLAPRLAVASEVIDNSGPPSATRAQLTAAWSRLRGRRP